MLTPPSIEALKGMIGNAIQLIIVDAGSMTFVLSKDMSIVGQHEVTLATVTEHISIFPATSENVRLCDLINLVVNDISIDDKVCTLHFASFKLEFHTSEFFEGYSISIDGKEYIV